MDDGMSLYETVLSKLLTKNVVYGCVPRVDCQQCGMPIPFHIRRLGMD